MKQLIALFSLVFLVLTTSMSANAKAKKCSDFRTHSQAQAYYKKLKATKQTGWKRMDKNKDGVACESLLKGKKKKASKKTTSFKSKKADKKAKTTKNMKKKKSMFDKKSKTSKLNKKQAKKKNKSTKKTTKKNSKKK